ncbi:PIN domain-like protein [Scleroderma yunnanense]
MFSWHQAGTGKSHEMRIIFCRLAAISQMLLHPHFIFDGSECPWFKLDKEPISAPPLLVQHFQELLTAFGFNWHIAPAEAEAELAYFYSHGLVDAVVTPFSDVLFIPSPSKYRDVEVYMSDALQHGPFLEWGDLLLMALMNGAGYDFGLPGCNMDISHCLAWYGLGRSLAQAVTEQKLADFMSFVAKWCKDLYYELAFPNPAILAAYLSPLTSWTGGGHPPVSVVTSRQPDLAALATFCSQCLGWSMDNLRPRLMDAHTGAIIHSLLQIPGNIDGQALQNCLQVMNYCDGPLLLYEISLPHQHLPAASTDINNTHVGLSGEESDSTSLDMKVPALVLELSRPELVQGPTSSPTSQSILEGEDEGDMVIDLTFDTAYFDTGVIDLTGED